MDELLTQFMISATQGPQALEKLLDEHQSKLTPELASAARQRFKQAISEQEGGTAMLATIVASSIYGRLGDRFNELRNRIDFVQIRFMAAESVDEYSQARDLALQLLTMAKALPSPPLAFEAATLGADCAFFASGAASGTSGDQWLVTTLQDLLVAFDHVGQAKHDAVFEKFVELSASAVDGGMSKMFLEPQQIQVDALLRQIAGSVECLIPIDFEFRGNTVQTSKVATVFAALTDKYGNQVQ